MKVLQIASASTGGIGRLTRDISDILIQNGIESRIAYGRGQVFDPSRDFMFGTKMEIYFHVLMSRLDDACGLWSKRGTKDLLDFIDNYKPDIVQLHNLHGYYLNYVMLFRYLKERDIPTVWTLHDCWCLTGHCTNFAKINCQRWMDRCGECKQSATYPQSLVDKSERNLITKQAVFSSLDKLTLITPSEWLANLVRSSYLSKYPIKVVNNGIDLSVFNVKDDLVSSDKKIVLGCASTWSVRKGLPDLIQLASILPDEYQVTIVGLKKSQLSEIPQNVRAICHTENVDELVDLYNQAFIFVNPTYEDNFPTTNLEAMACGTSVITYKTGGSVESVTKETGYILDQGDVNGIAATIVNHKKTPETIRQCRLHAEQYDKWKAYKTYLSIYHEILKA